MVNIRSKMGIQYQVKYRMYNPKKGWYWEHITPKNTLTELMDVLAADRISGGTDALMTHCHCGTGTGQGSSSTNLATHIDEARTAVDSTTQGSGAADNDIVIVTTFGAGVCTATITECGMFSAEAQATADMKAYDDTINKVKAADDTLEVTWTFTFGAS